jgi:hypothetical protein
MRRALVAAVLPVALVAATVSFGGAAYADSSNAAYSWHVADALLEEAAGSPPVAIAEASSGETVEVDGTGVMDAGDKTASGGGTIVHKAADGSVVAQGTWTAHRLISFQFYGCSDEIVPGVTLCGGLAKLEITATPEGTSLEFPATLWIDCLIGEKIPSGGEAGSA